MTAETTGVRFGLDIPMKLRGKLLLTCSVGLFTMDCRMHPPNPAVTRTTYAHQPIDEVRTKEQFDSYWKAVGEEVWKSYQGN